MEINETIPIVTPGDGTVNGENIPPYTNSWEMIAVNPDESITRRGIWNDEISFYTNKGKEILRREQHVYYNDREVIHNEEIYRETLMPIKLKIQNKGEESHTDIYFEEKRISGKKIFNIEGLNVIQKVSSQFSIEFPEVVFDWHLWGILISGFPLKEGYCARFLAHESYSYLPGDFRWFTLKVTGKEIIDGGKWGNKISCWTVEVKAEVMWKLWIAVQKDIAPVQQIRIDNTDGVQLWWKPLKTNMVETS